MTARLPATVGVFEPIYNGGLPYVGVDDVAGARKLIDLLLLAEGHRKIAFIGDSRTRLAYSRRRQGFEEGMDAANMRPENRIVVDGDGTIESGVSRSNSSSCRTACPPPSCASTTRPPSASCWPDGARLQHPARLSVTGFDDVPLSASCRRRSPPSASPRTAIGKRAMALLLDLLGGSEPPEGNILLMPDLVVRNSVGPPKGMR